MLLATITLVLSGDVSSLYFQRGWKGSDVVYTGLVETSFEVPSLKVCMLKCAGKSFFE
jgi:hypothetical protein